MTTLFVAQIKLEVADGTTSAGDVLEVLSLQTVDRKIDDVWVTAVCGRLTEEARSEICRSLGIASDHIVRIKRPLDAVIMTRLYGSAIAHLGGYRRVVLYDANADAELDDFALDSTSLSVARNGIFGHLQRLDEYHGENRITDIVRCLVGLLGDLDNMRSSSVREFGFRLRPLSRFVRTLHALLLSPPPADDGRGADRHDSLSLIDFSDDVARLNQMFGELDYRFARLDFVEPSTNFFRYGSRALGVLRTTHRSRLREVFPDVLSWWHVYHLAVSKEFGNLGYFPTALLHLVRAFETYALGLLWRYGQVEVKGLRERPYLADGREPGFDVLLNALLRTIPEAGMEELYEGINDLRQSRNRNVLVHGFHLPEEAVIRRARASVKGVVARAERQLGRDGLIRGVLGDFGRGENRRGDMGRVIAEVLLDTDVSKA